MRINITGDLSVRITNNLRNELLVSVIAKRGVTFSYCPQQSTVDIVEHAGGLREVNLKYPSHFQLTELTIASGAKVILEGLDIACLKLQTLHPRSQAILRSNRLDELMLHSDSRNTIDMTMQALPKKFSHQLHKDTVVRMPNQGPPTCIVCYENEITQMFVACGHWCLCSACSSMNHCPVCRRESEQVRIYQQSTVHNC